MSTFEIVDSEEPKFYDLGDKMFARWSEFNGSTFLNIRFCCAFVFKTPRQLSGAMRSTPAER